MKKILIFITAIFLSIGVFGQDLNYVNFRLMKAAINAINASKADTSLSNLGGAGIAVISGIVHDSLTAVLNNADDGIAVADTADMLAPYALLSEVGSGGLSSGDVAAQINDSIVARLSVAVPGIRVADTASMLSPYALLSEVSGGGITASDTAAMLAPYFTEPEIRKADSDTIPLFVFGAGSGGLESDTALFTATNIYGAFYNDKDTIIATSLRAVLIAGTTPLGTDTLAIQVFWNDTINAVFAPTARLNTNYLPVTSTTLGTEDTSFNTSIIPPGVWVFCKSTAGTTGRKPKALYVTLYGFKRNRTY
jgi:hypothetical protein